MDAIRDWVSLYTQQFKTTFAAMLQYRASLFIWMISAVLEPLVYLIVWSAVSKSCQAENKMSTNQDLKKSTFQDSKSPLASFPVLLTFAKSH
jgi:ABC-type uncharacterized transport system permease subunit